MKRIEEIQDLSIEELETLSEGVAAPEGLEGRLEAALAAQRALGHETRRTAYRRWIPVAATALAALALVFAVGLPSRNAPKDTFDDPLLAYAQVEQTFGYISSRMAEGVNMVRDAQPISEIPARVIDKINGK